MFSKSNEIFVPPSLPKMSHENLAQIATIFREGCASERAEDDREEPGGDAQSESVPA